MQKKWVIAVGLLALIGLLAGWAFAMMLRTETEPPRQSAIVVTTTPDPTPTVDSTPPTGTASPSGTTSPPGSPSPSPSAAPTAPETVTPAKPHAVDDDDDDDDYDDDDDDD